MIFPLRGADGVFRPFLTRAVPIRNRAGEIVRWYGVNTEIWAQVKAEAALLASETKYETLADTMPQMVWSTLPDGYHDYYNAHWYEFTGVPAGSTDGEAWNGMFHPDDQDRAWARWRKSCRPATRTTLNIACAIATATIAGCSAAHCPSAMARA